MHLKAFLLPPSAKNNSSNNKKRKKTIQTFQRNPFKFWPFSQHCHPPPLPPNVYGLYNCETSQKYHEGNLHGGGNAYHSLAPVNNQIAFKMGSRLRKGGQADRQAGRQTGRQAGRQTGREAESHAQHDDTFTCPSLIPRCRRKRLPISSQPDSLELRLSPPLIDGPLTNIPQGTDFLPHSIWLLVHIVQPSSLIPSQC